MVRRAFRPPARARVVRIDERWFAGKRVLDGGGEQGRYTRALLELGADGIAVDYSEAGLERTRALCTGFPRLQARRVNLLDIAHDLARERLDLVFSFRVLHHTGHNRRALSSIAALVGDSGALFLYLYDAEVSGGSPSSMGLPRRSGRFSCRSQ